MLARLGLAVLFLSASASVVPAQSSGWHSAYQEISARACPDLSPKPARQRGDHEAIVRTCPAFLGFRVVLHEGPNRHELRVMRLGRQGNAGTLVFLSGLGPRIEWRGPLRDGRIVPRAMIVRVGAADLADEKSTLLAIMNISPEAVCLLGVVDVRANPDANGLARRKADELAERSSCDQPAVVLGESSAFAEAFVERLR